MSGDGLPSVLIRYDGFDAVNHEIELLALGQSLQGIARLLAVTGHFAVTHQYAKQQQALSVRVLVREPAANCYSLLAVLDFAKQHQILSGSAGALLGLLISWIISRLSGNREEMKALKDALDKAITTLAGQNSEVVGRLSATIERMAESLRPSVISAVAPVGKSCRQMRIGDSQVIDEATAEAIRAERADEVTETRDWQVLITELDLESHSAKIRFVDSAEQDDKRYRAEITDPALMTLNNRYMAAFANQTTVTIRGKATLREGEIQALFVSDLA